MSTFFQALRDTFGTPTAREPDFALTIRGLRYRVISFNKGKAYGPTAEWTLTIEALNDGTRPIYVPERISASYREGKKVFAGDGMLRETNQRLNPGLRAILIGNVRTPHDTVLDTVFLHLRDKRDDPGSTARFPVTGKTRS